MLRNEFFAVESAYSNIISEARQKWRLSEAKLVTKTNNFTLVEVKEALLSLSNMKTWKEFVDSQKPGECHLIAQSVSRMFPKLLMYSVVIDFSEQAKAKMELQTDPDMYKCTHYLNMFEDTLIDFGKATNRYEGVYVLDGIDDMYSHMYSLEAKKLIKINRKEDPKALGMYLN